MPAQRGFCPVWSRDRMRRGVNLAHGRTRRSAPTHNVRSTRAIRTFVRKAGLEDGPGDKLTFSSGCRDRKPVTAR